MTEIISIKTPEIAQKHLATYGHVALHEVYDARLGLPASRKIWTSLVGRPHDTVLGEQKGNLSLSYSDRPTNPLSEVMSNIVLGVRQLGRSVEPRPGERQTTQVILHTPGTVGEWHKDRKELVDAIAITNLQGPSTLEIEGDNGLPDVDYTLDSGIVVVLDHSRRLRHRGIAGPTERVGLLITKERAT